MTCPTKSPAREAIAACFALSLGPCMLGPDFDPLEGWMPSSLAARSGGDGDVRAASVCQPSKAAKTISHDCGAGRDDPFGEALNAGAFETGDAADLEAQRPPVAIRLNGRDHRLLAGAADLAAAALAAQVGVVHLDPALQRDSVVHDPHHLGKLGLDLPGRGLCDAEAAPQFDRGDALLGLGYEIHGAEPRRQRRLCRVEHRARRQRRLPPARVALIQRARTHDAVNAAGALGAHETVRPAPVRDRCPADVFGSVQGHETGLRKTL